MDVTKLREKFYPVLPFLFVISNWFFILNLFVVIARAVLSVEVIYISNIMIFVFCFILWLITFIVSDLPWVINLRNHLLYSFSLLGLFCAAFGVFLIANDLMGKARVDVPLYKIVSLILIGAVFYESGRRLQKCKN